MLQVQASRTTQPYRRGVERGVSPVLSAMLAGKPFFTPNPMDVQREIQRRARLSALLAMRSRA